MVGTLYSSPRTYSYNFACDVVEKLYNPNYRTLAEDFDSPVKASPINSYVTFFYVNDELVAVYDEISGNLYATKFGGVQ